MRLISTLALILCFALVTESSAKGHKKHHQKHAKKTAPHSGTHHRAHAYNFLENGAMSMDVA